MRNTFIFAAALMLIAACQSVLEEQIQEQPEVTDETVVDEGETKIQAPDITAEQEDDNPTKSVLEVDSGGVGTIYWTPADEINVFYGTTSTHYVSQNTVNATTAVFTTTDVIGSTESASDNIWGLYPYNPSATCTGTAITTTLPATQYGIPGTFDDDLFITLAHNTSTALKFYNVCGGIKFSLSRDDITSITFRGNNNEYIVGDFSLSFVEDIPNVSVTSGAKTITLLPKTGNAFVSGEDYYIILRPVTLSNGFTMTFETNTGYIGTFNYTAKSIVIKRSIFGKKSSIDTYAEFVSNPVQNLSSSGTANCYIVSSPGTYKFRTVKGNSNTSVGDIKGVRVLWETFGTNVTPSLGDVIKADVSYADDYITFSTCDTFHEGNALIAAYSDSECTDGNVLWSWHIWCTDPPAEQEYKNNAGIMLDRNIGATGAGIRDNCSPGLLFQWGRKDPMIGLLVDAWRYNHAAFVGDGLSVVFSDSTIGTIDYATKHPTTFIRYESPVTNYDWYYTGSAICDNTRWMSSKTIYDPCPAGWRVPDGIGSSIWEKANNYSTTFYSEDFSFYNYQASGTENCGGVDCTNRFEKYSYNTIWYPYTGYILAVESPYDDRISNGDRGFYWTCTPLPKDEMGYYNASILSVTNSQVLLTYGFRARAHAVRCQKE